jgi:hypothetical protein
LKNDRETNPATSLAILLIMTPHRLRPQPNESWRMIAKPTPPLYTRSPRSLSKFALAQ